MSASLIEQDKNNQSPRTLFREFCTTTSGHGFFKVSNTEHRGIRIFWLVLLILAVVGGFVHIGMIIKRYLDFDVNAEIEIQGDSPFDFPDVTVCPNSRYFFRGGFSPTLVNKPFYLMRDSRVPSLGDNVTFEKIWDNSNRVWNALLENPANNSQRKMARFSTDPYVVEAQVVRHTLSVVTHCLYQGQECDYKNYTDHYHPDVHLCITFNSSNLAVTNTDSDAGLKMRLLLPYIGSDDEEEAKFMTGEEHDLRLSGATVILHPKGTLPYLSETNFVVSRGQKATVAMEMKTMEYMEVHGRCSSKMKAISIVGSSKAFAYSRHACQQVYFQKVVVSKCYCRSELYYTPTSLKDEPFCHQLREILFTFDNHTTNGNGDWILWRNGEVSETIPKIEMDTIKQRYECHARVTDSLKDSPPDLMRICPVPCSVSSYDISVNIAEINEMNSPDEIQALVSHYTQQLKLWKTEGKYTQVLEKFLVDIPYDVRRYFPRVYLGSLNLYPASRMRKVIKELLTYPMENFLSDFGGVFGFWLGFSIITLIEIVEMISLICGITICSKNKSNPNQVNPT